MRTFAHALLLLVVGLAFVLTAREYTHRTPAHLGAAPAVTQAAGPVAEEPAPTAGPVVRQGRGFAPTPHEEPGPAEQLAHVLAPVLGPRELPPAVILPLPRPRPAPHAKPARRHHAEAGEGDGGAKYLVAR